MLDAISCVTTPLQQRACLAATDVEAALSLPGPDDARLLQQIVGDAPAHGIAAVVEQNLHV